MEEIKQYAKIVAEYCVCQPLWVRLSVGTCCLGIFYIKHRYRALDDVGVYVLPDSGLKYNVQDSGLIKLGEVLLEGNHTTVAYYNLLQPTFATIDTDLIKKIFTTHFHNFPTRMPTDSSFGAGRIGLSQLNVTPDLHQWKRMRSTLTPGFSTRQMNEMFSHTKIVIQQLCKDLEKRNGRKISALVVGGKFSMDAFLRSAMSMDNEDLLNIEDFTELPIYKNFCSAFDLSVTLLLCMFVPYLGDIFDLLGICSQEGMEWTQRFAQNLINERLGEKSGRKSDFLNLMLENQLSEKEAKMAPKGFTNDEIISQIFTLFGGGFETTRSALEWVFYFLAKNPEIQEKVRAEVQSIDDFLASDLSFEKVPWTCAVHAEVLRIRAPLQVHFRRCVKDIEINNIKFRKGNQVQVPVMALHTSETYWGDKCTEFSPQRFVENPDLMNEWYYTPFGAGPRNCLGMRFGLMQGRACTAYLVKNFNIRLADDFVDDVKFINKGLFGKSSKPIELQFEKI